MEDLPALESDVIRRRPALCHASLERPVSWLGARPIVGLVRLPERPRRLKRLHEDWSALMPRDEARDLLAWLLERGILLVVAS